jgi:tetratricopeptide (TPR) repeat protein
MSEPMRTSIGLLLFLVAVEGAAQKSPDLTALLTQVEGPVTLSSAGRAEIRPIRIASQRQVIRRGEIVHVPAGAQVTLICSTETLVSLTGRRDWIFDATACERGRPLPEGSYRSLASYAGRILPKNGTLLLELETRNGDEAVGPVLLSPRNTAVMDPYPRLVWTQVPDAIEYEIQLRGPVGTSIRLAADCGPGTGPWHDLDVCTWAPSGKWPALEPEKPVVLKLGSRSVLAAPVRQAREAYEIHLLSVSDQHHLQEKLQQIAALPVDPTSRLLLTAGAYAQSELYADAIVSYEEALRAQEIPEARVTLGDLYLDKGLTALAEREYRQVGTHDPAAQAAAELGLGSVAYFRKLFSEARTHFERARDLYTTLGLAVEAEDARAAGARVQAENNHDMP